MGLIKMNVHNAESAKALADLVKREREEKLKSARKAIMEIIEERASNGFYEVQLNAESYKFDIFENIIWLENLGFSVNIVNDPISVDRYYIIKWG